MLIAVGERDIGATSHISGQKISAKIGNLEMIVGEKKSSGNFMERQSLAQKNVIHPTQRIDIDFKPRAFAAGKLIDTVRRDCRRLTKFVRRDVFRQIGIDPETYFRR